MANEGVALRCDEGKSGQTLVYAVGTGTPRPGWNKDNYADAIFELILKASQGQDVLPAAGQRGDWLHNRARVHLPFVPVTRPFR